MRFSPVLFVLAIAAAGCGGGGHSTSIPAERTAAAPSSFAVPSRPTHAVPARKTLSVPALPKSIAGRPPAANAARPAFFNGEAALSNGVYYLAFQNGTPFGYYSYLSDPHYIFHFDLGYQYYFDSTDPNNQYLYDFPSGHFWYTGANLFPYVYDFTLNAFLYYYPDTQQAGHYTTNPRYFYNFGTNQIIRLPDPLPPTDPNCPTGAPQSGSTCDAAVEPERSRRAAHRSVHHRPRFGVLRGAHERERHAADRTARVELRVRAGAGQPVRRDRVAAAQRQPHAVLQPSR